MELVRQLESLGQDNGTPEIIVVVQECGELQGGPEAVDAIRESNRALQLEGELAGGPEGGAWEGDLGGGEGGVLTGMGPE